MLGKIEKKRVGQRMKWLDCITDSLNMNVSKLQEIVKDKEGSLANFDPGGCRVRHDLVTELTTTCLKISYQFFLSINT